jgi:KUP system potassium uptake protein
VKCPVAQPDIVQPARSDESCSSRLRCALMSQNHHEHRASFALLSLGALGVVFGDIGTSPLYTLKECLHAAGDTPSEADVLGILSLISWSLTMVVTVKYLLFMMKADNKGEGGIFALLALVPKRQSRVAITGISVLVVIGAALLYGDGTITPAISVLSAIEGLKDSVPSLAPLVIPLTCGILFALFLVQRRGTGTIGKAFGPIMIVWFGTIGLLGAYQVVLHPTILRGLSPTWGVHYFVDHGVIGAVILGSVVLAVTGGEALYADMGHFGRGPIRAAWLGFVMPALVLAYFGQGALWLADPTIDNPFFAMAPAGNWQLALVILSSAATVIASQALISGAFSLTRQAMLLGFFPRVTIKHTSRDSEGQIYIPEINWLLAAGCILLVLAFRSSDALAAAYGIAVTGTMGITSIVYFIVTRQTWGWPRSKAVPLLVLFLAFDASFFAANLAKFFDGGYVPMLIGVAFIAAMLIWSRGRTLMVEEFTRRFPSLADARVRLGELLVTRVPGTAVFLASSTEHVPPSLMRVAERCRTMHEHIVLVTVAYDDAPTVPDTHRSQYSSLGEGFHRIVIHVGYMEQPSVHDVVSKLAGEHALPFDDKHVTYYLGRETILHSEKGRMGRLAETLYAYLQRNAVSADQGFGIPPAQVVEIGTQIDL